MATKLYKVYGNDGKPQQEASKPSHAFDWSEGETRKLMVLNKDMTGSDEYTLIHIERNTEEDVEAELEGQLLDGVFENFVFGNVEDVTGRVNLERDYRLYVLDMPNDVKRKLLGLMDDPSKLPKGKKKLIGYYDMVADGPIHVIYSVYAEYEHVYEEINFFGNTGDLLETMQRNLSKKTIFTPWRGNAYKCIFFDLWE